MDEIEKAFVIGITKAIKENDNDLAYELLIDLQNYRKLYKEQ